MRVLLWGWEGSTNALQSGATAILAHRLKLQGNSRPSQSFGCRIFPRVYVLFPHKTSSACGIPWERHFVLQGNPAQWQTINTPLCTGLCACMSVRVCVFLCVSLCMYVHGIQRTASGVTPRGLFFMCMRCSCVGAGWLLTRSLTGLGLNK